MRNKDLAANVDFARSQQDTAEWGPGPDTATTGSLSSSEVA
jgi:hypothetical protein